MVAIGRIHQHAQPGSGPQSCGSQAWYLLDIAGNIVGKIICASGKPSAANLLVHDNRMTNAVLQCLLYGTCLSYTVHAPAYAFALPVLSAVSNANSTWGICSNYSTGTIAVHACPAEQSVDSCILVMLPLP